MMKKGFFLTLFTLAILVVPGIFAANKAYAVSGSDWKAGNIISDSIFYDSDSMSLVEIQAFLNSLVPTCDTWGTRMHETVTNKTRAQVGTENGNPPPYICVKDYHENPTTRETNFNPTASIPAGAQSAAQIIYNSAKTYNISPRVILVTIKKEAASNLIADDWPWIGQYRSALGYACPDTAPCDSQYYGFYNQVRNSARQFRLYADNPASYRRKAGEISFIQYNPNAACSGTNVYVENQATAGLYNYTPYQPNYAALANLYGTGDSCSAYGNRNFWRIWNDWFGETHTPDYAWSLISQEAFTDSTKTTATGLGNLTPGQKRYLRIAVKNTGNNTWTNNGANPVRVGTVRDTNRSSAFYDETWLGYSRPAVLREASVAPGAIGTFEFWIKAPESSQGQFKEYFSLLSEGKAWMPDIGMYYNITVEPARYTWQLVSQYAFSDIEKTKPTGLFNQYPGEKKYVGVQIKNTGNVIWTNNGANPMRLGITHPTERWSAFMSEGWLGPSRPATMKEVTVAPGETASFEFWMQAPSSQSGLFREYFSPLLEGKMWLEDIGLNFAASVVQPSYTWQLTSQYAYTDSSKVSAIGLDNLLPGQRVYVGFTAKNTGNVPWFNTDDKHPIDVGTANPTDRSSRYCTSGWLGCNRPARMIESVVLPGQEATFEFWVQAPTQSGRYLEYFNLVAEQAAWMNSFGFNYSINVR